MDSVRPRDTPCALTRSSRAVSANQEAQCPRDPGNRCTRRTGHHVRHRSDNGGQDRCYAQHTEHRHAEQPTEGKKWTPTTMSTHTGDSSDNPIPRSTTMPTVWRSVRRQHISSTRDQAAYGRSSELAEPPPRPRRQRTRSRRRAGDQAPRIRQRDGIHPHEDDPADSTNERTKSPIHSSMKPPVQEDQNKVAMSAKRVQRAPRRGVELGDRRVGPCRDPGLRHPLRRQLPTQRGRDPLRGTVVSRCVVRQRQWDAIRSLE